MKKVFVIGFAVVWLNGCACIIHCIVLGGSALNGKVEGEKCYVGNAGRYTEVSQSTFQFSQWHEITVMSGIACAVLAGFVVALVKRPETI